MGGAGPLPPPSYVTSVPPPPPLGDRAEDFLNATFGTPFPSGSGTVMDAPPPPPFAAAPFTGGGPPTARDRPPRRPADREPGGYASDGGRGGSSVRAFEDVGFDRRGHDRWDDRRDDRRDDRDRFGFPFGRPDDRDARTDDRYRRSRERSPPRDREPCRICLANGFTKKSVTHATAEHGRTPGVLRVPSRKQDGSEPNDRGSPGGRGGRGDGRAGGAAGERFSGGDRDRRASGHKTQAREAALRTKPCRYWSRGGKCEAGASCGFAHE